MNLSEMRAIVRRDLKDEDAANYPYEQKATKATTASSRDVDISSLSDRIMVQAVEYPVDKFPQQLQRFSLWGDNITLLGDEVPDGSNAYIYYGKLHNLGAESSTIPSYLEDLVVAGACSYAAVEWAVYAINRVNVGGTMTPREFLAWGNEKLRFFKDELKRLGRRNRVRVRSMYMVKDRWQTVDLYSAGCLA